MSELCNQTTDEMLIVSPFLKLSAVSGLLGQLQGKKLRLITRYDLEDCVAGVQDLAALRHVLTYGGRVRGIKNLHAKLFVSDAQRALITSMNLTSKALHTNLELGVLSENPDMVGDCVTYFETLWDSGKQDLSKHALNKWSGIVDAEKRRRQHQTGTPKLPDFGVRVEKPEAPETKAMLRKSVEPFAVTDTAFLKFLGQGHDRAALDFDTKAEVERSGCNWAVGYPNSQRPRQPSDGDWMYFARLVHGDGPNDIRIFGRGRAQKHIEGRDEANAAEIARLNWKDRWGNYVRIDHPEILCGTMRDGISLNEMARILQSDLYQSTQRNAEAGQGNVSPSKSIGQKAGIMLSSIAAGWLDRVFVSKSEECGLLDGETLAEIDRQTRPPHV